MQKYVIIVAGGSGSRMGSEIPKQFLLINGLPILMHTINRFFDYDKDISLILVLPEKQIEYWRDLCQKYNFKIAHQIAKGGETRYHSVKNGLKLISNEGIVAVHDGVRPLVNTNVILKCFETAMKKGNAIPYVNIKESIRKIENDNSFSLERDNYIIVQTPQVFKSELIINAYKIGFKKRFTDDASIIEDYGEKINLIKGNDENIKITNKIDLKYAELLLNNAF